MALSTWNWDDFGRPISMDPTDICHTISHQYGGGYDASRPAATKMQKAFAFGWNNMSTAQWLAFVEFWRSVRGNANAFYWPFPIELYGAPGYGGYGGLEPSDGFDADIEVGYGEGPIFTTKFISPELPQKWKSRTYNRWIVSTAVREVA
jgi:hypothetical protein